MENTLMELAAANGIWAALFVFLFIYVLYDSRKREKKYQEWLKNKDKPPQPTAEDRLEALELALLEVVLGG